jgi:hypothetical protein
MTSVLNLLNPNVHASPITDADRRAIRALWIDDRRESYSIDFLASLLHTSSDRVENAALDLNTAGELDREEALILAEQFFSPSQIEDVLGADASTALPPGRRTRLVTLRLSVWLLEALESWSASLSPNRETDAVALIGRERDRCVDVLVYDALEFYCDTHFRMPPHEADAAATTAVDKAIN